MKRAWNLNYAIGVLATDSARKIYRERHGCLHELKEDGRIWMQGHAFIDLYAGHLYDIRLDVMIEMDDPVKSAEEQQQDADDGPEIYHAGPGPHEGAAS